jgi:hypothetical protein
MPPNEAAEGLNMHQLKRKWQKSQGLISWLSAQNPTQSWRIRLRTDAK